MRHMDLPFSLRTLKSVLTASGNMSKHQPARKTTQEKHAGCPVKNSHSECVFNPMYKCSRTNSEYTSSIKFHSYNGSEALQVAKLWHAGFSSCTEPRRSYTVVQTSNLWGRTMPAGATQDFKGSVQLISKACARFNCRFRPLPRIEVWLGFVHKREKSNSRSKVCDHSYEAFSNRMRSIRDVFKVCLGKFDTYRVNMHIWSQSAKKVTHSSCWNGNLRCRHYTRICHWSLSNIWKYSS